MQVDRIEFDDFEPMEAGPVEAGPVEAGPIRHLRDGGGPESFGPPHGSVSLISRGGRLQVSLLPAPREPRRALISAVRLLLRRPDLRGGADS